MISKKYGKQHAKLRMAYRLHSPVKCDVVKNIVRGYKNVRNNDTYENCFNEFKQNLNHDGIFETATKPLDTNTNILFTNASGDSIESITTKTKLKISNTTNKTENFHLTPIETQYVTCSRNIQNKQFKTGFKNNYKRDKAPVLQDNTFSTKNKNTCADKVTYCRPINNSYNQAFVYKTMLRNERLQQLLRKMISLRKRENQDERWNNYINELRNKHCTFNESDNSTYPIPEDTVGPEDIDNYYNTRFQWQQSNQCQDLLEDFYGPYNNIKADAFYQAYGYNNRPQPSCYKPFMYQNHPYCYPTSSQARLIRLNKERGINKNDNWRSYPSSRYFNENTIIVDNDNSIESRKLLRTPRTVNYPFMPVKKHVPLKNYAAQTDSTTISQLSGEDFNVDVKEETIKQKYNRVSKNVFRLKKKIEKPQDDMEPKSLTNIENKLNDLLQSINACLIEIKRNIRSKKIESISVSCQIDDKYIEKLNMANSDSHGVFKTQRIVCGIAQSVCRSTLTLKNISPKREKLNGTSLSQIDDILCEELNKSNRVKRDIDDIINGQIEHPCDVHITFEIPTRDRATEVTASLSKARLNTDKITVVEETDRPKEERMTIAVNTDPLGLLALLKISTEAVKRILSYMPQIDYYSYLPMIQFPQSSRDGVTVSHYVCSICGASFGRPSQLSDHIQKHNLGYSRDCCVCRHVLDMPRSSRHQTFPCQYCGQRFTRAYCCQLHEDTCAKRLGAKHDVASSLMLLS